MQPEAPAQKPRRERHLVRWIFIGILVILGWRGWKGSDSWRAIREAKALSWRVDYSNPFPIIEDDWRNAFHKETWDGDVWRVTIGSNNPVEGHLALIRRLNPTSLTIDARFPESDLSELAGLSKLHTLILNDCQKLTNIGALQGMKGLVVLHIHQAPDLADIHPLTELKNLNHLGLDGCTALTNLDALQGHHDLRILSLHGCSGLKNLDGISGLTELRMVNFRGCAGLKKEALDKIREGLRTGAFVEIDSK